MSKLYRRSISDNQLTKECGFIEQLNSGDIIMADKGFNVQDLFALKHVRLLAPPIISKGKVSAKATTMTRRIAKMRVHVEQMIRKLKCFQLIHTVIPLTLKPYASSIIQVCACLVNLSPSIIDRDSNWDSENYDRDGIDCSHESDDND